MLHLVSLYKNRSDFHNPIQSLACMRLAAYVAAKLPDLSIKISNIEIDTPINDIALLLKNAKIISLSNYVWSYEKCRQIAHKIADTFPDKLIIAGGPQLYNKDLSLWPEGVIFIAGEGEKPLADVCTLYLDNRLDHFKLPESVFSNFSSKSFYRSIVSNPLPEEGLILFGEEFLNRVSLKLDLNYPILWESSRGCPFGCGFCGHSQRKIPFRFSKERIENEIKAIGAMKIPRLFIIDPIFGGGSDGAKMILELFGKYAPNVELMLYFRPEQVNEDIIRLLSRSNISEISLGLQTINPKIPRWIRNNNMDLVRFNLPLLNQTTIPWRLEFITGLPGDTPESFCQSLKFGVEMKPTWLYSYWLTCIEGTKVEAIEGKYSEDWWVRANEKSQVIASNSYSENEMKWMLTFGMGICSLNNYLFTVKKQTGNYERMNMIVSDAMRDERANKIFMSQNMEQSVAYWKTNG